MVLSCSFWFPLRRPLAACSHLKEPSRSAWSVAFWKRTKFSCRSFCVFVPSWSTMRIRERSADLAWTVSHISNGDLRQKLGFEFVVTVLAKDIDALHIYAGYRDWFRDCGWGVGDLTKYRNAVTFATALMLLQDVLMYCRSTSWIIMWIVASAALL